MKVRQKIKNTIKGLTLAGALAVSSVLGAGCANTNVSTASLSGSPSAKVALTEIASSTPTGSVRRDRQEVLVKGLPAGSDVYATREQDSNGNHYSIMRGQVRPLEVEVGDSALLSLGAAYKMFDAGAVSRNEVGASVGIRGKLFEDVKAFADVRGYTTGNLESFGGFKYGNLSGTLLSSYSTDTGASMLRPGLWYGITPNLSVGVESKWSGTNTDVEHDYAGLGLKLEFGGSK